jgi:hypothetical protein
MMVKMSSLVVVGVHEGSTYMRERRDVHAMYIQGTMLNVTLHQKPRGKSVSREGGQEAKEEQGNRGERIPTSSIQVTLGLLEAYRSSEEPNCKDY